MWLSDPKHLREFTGTDQFNVLETRCQGWIDVGGVESSQLETWAFPGQRERITRSSGSCREVGGVEICGNGVWLILHGDGQATRVGRKDVVLRCPR